MSDVLEKQMKNEETLASKAISKAITAALNSKPTIAKADEIEGMCGGWPYAPSKNMLKMYGKVSETAWKKLKPRYKNFDVSIAVKSPSNRPPLATANAVFDGEWRGGVCKKISVGDTILSLSKTIYGYESYADQVFEANAKALGKSCRALPAGFGLDFPKIWVPSWKKEPKVCKHPCVKKKAVKVKLPSMQREIDFSHKTAQQFLIGNAFVFVELKGNANLVATKKGNLDPSFTIKAYEAEIKKGLGPLEAGFKVGVKEASGSLAIKVFGVKVAGISFSGKLNIRKVDFELKFGSKRFTMMSKGIKYTGTITMTAKIKILPNLRYDKKRVKEKDFEFNISAGEVAVVVAVGVLVFVSGAWVVAGVAVAASEAAAWLGAMAFGAFLAAT